MATNTDIFDKNTNTLQGMAYDYEPQVMPKNMYRYALNAVKDKVGSLKTEKSTAPCWQNMGLDINILLGTVTTDNSIVLIYQDSPPNNYIHIVEVDENCDALQPITHLVFSCLNLNPNYAIHGTWHMLNGCDKWIYLTNGHDPLLRIKLDNNYYGSNPITNCDQTKLIKDIQYPRFEDAWVETGGQMYIGSYNFAIRYLDSTGNKTAWLVVSRPINIYDSSNKTYEHAVGDTNAEFHPYGHAKVNKRIVLKISRIDTRFEYYQVAVIRSIRGTEDIDDVLVSEEYPIQGDEELFIYSGNDDNYSTGDLDELQFDQYKISTAKAITNYAGRLILANTSEQYRDICKLNRYAITSRVTYINNPSADNINDRYDPKNHTYTFYADGFMPGEVYALGIAYVFDNGDVSPVFHIPGRPTFDDVSAGTGETLTTVAFNHADNFLETTSPKWKIYDTSVEAKNILSSQTSGALNLDLLWYWEEQDPNIVYTNPPNVEDCCEDFWKLLTPDDEIVTNPNLIADLNDGFPYNNTGENLLNKPVRHHRIPTRQTVPIINVASEISYKCVLSCTINTSSYNDGASHDFSIDYTDCDGNTQTYSFSQTVDSDSTTVEVTFCNAQCDGSLTVTGVTIDGTATTDFTYNTEETNTTYSGIHKNVITLKIETYIPDDMNIQGVILFRGRIKNHLVIDSGYTVGYVPGTCAKADGGKDDHPSAYENYIFTGNRAEYLCDDCTSNHYSAKDDYETTDFDKVGYTSDTIDFIQNLQDLSGAYIRVTNKMFMGPDYRVGTVKTDTWQGTGGTNHDSSYCTMTAYIRLINSDISFNRLIDAGEILQPATHTTSSSLFNSWDSVNKIINASQSNKVIAMKLHNSVRFETYYAYLTHIMRHESVVYGPLDTIMYDPISNGVIPVTSGKLETEVTGGMTFTAYHKTINSYIRALLNSGMSSEEFAETFSQKHQIVTAYVDEEHSTEACNSKMSRQCRIAPFSDYAFVYDNCTDAVSEHTLAWQNILFRQTYHDSWVNTGLLFGYQDTKEYYNRFELDNVTYDEYFCKHLLDNCEERTGAGPLAEYYAYNYSFNRWALGKTKTGLPAMFDICSNCLNRFPNSIFWSQPQLSETSEDAWTQFAPNDYNTIPSDTGDINAVRSAGNKLWAFTDNAVYYYPMPTQQMIGSDMSVYIGTGEFLSIGPYKIPYEFGMQDAISILLHDIGFIFIDYIRNKIFNLKLNTQVLPITDMYMSSFFSDNQFYLATNPYNVLAEHRTILGYDPLYDRIMITNGGISNRQLYTISYDTKTNTWVSFHSYYPSVYIWLGNDMYSLDHEYNTYRHNKPDSYLNIYGSLHNHEIEVISVNNSLLTKIYEYIGVRTKTFNYVNYGYVQDKDVSFNKYLAYTSNGSTGYIDIELMRDISDVLWVTKVEPNDKHYANYVNDTLVISKLTDYVTNYNDKLFTKQNGRYVVNTAVIDYNKNWYETNRLSDVFLGLLLIYEPQDDSHYITTEVIITTDKTNIR